MTDSKNDRLVTAILKVADAIQSNTQTLDSFTRRILPIISRHEAVQLKKEEIEQRRKNISNSF
jgi:hypothetical protein